MFATQVSTLQTHALHSRRLTIALVCQSRRRHSCSYDIQRRQCRSTARAGADYVIHYHETPEWGEAAKTLTGRNEGFDNVIKIGGPETMKQSFNAVKKEGLITLIGLVTGVDAQANISEAIARIVTMRGIHVGSKDQFEDMMAAMESIKIQAVIDEKVFQLEELVDALRYLVCLMNVGWRL